MSKRLILNEWSDDDIEGNEGLIESIESQSKRQKRQDLFNNNCIEELDKSSNSGNNLIKSICSSFSCGLTNIMSGINNRIFKSKSNAIEMYETVRPESQLIPRIGMNGMNTSLAFVTNSQTNTSFPMTSTNNNLQQNNYKIVNLPINVMNSSGNACNVVFLNSQQIPVQQISIIPAQYQYISNNNNSTNPLVLSQNENNLKVEQMKCQCCGQIASSPGRDSCGHCRRPMNQNRLVHNHNRISLPANNVTIPANRFYKSSANNSGSCRPSLPTVFSADVNQHNRSLSLNTSPRLHQLTPKRSLRPECIILDDGDSHKPEQIKTCNSNSADEECIEIPDSNTTKEAFCDIGMQCDFNSVENSEVDHNKSENNGIEAKSSTLSSSSSSSSSPINNKEESQLVLSATAFPDYIMFGTYRTEAKTMDFSSDGIKLTNVAPNNMETKFKYHIMIPFIEMKELLYCVDSSLPMILIKPMKESNDKIQECMYLGKGSTNGLKFDIESNDFREQNIITVLKEKLSEKFISILEKSLKNNNPDIVCSKLNIDKAKLYLHRVQNRSSNSGTSEHRYEQTILSANSRLPSIQGKQPNPFAVNAVRSKLNPSRDISLSPSPVKRIALRSPRRSTQFTPQVQTVILSDDDEEEDQETKNQTDQEFNQVILTYPKDEENAIQLTGNDICCLNKGEFLNDNIVNFYLRHYFRSERITDEVKKRTHIFDTLFFVQLTEKRPSKRRNSNGREELYTFEQRYNQKLKRWTKLIDIFSKDFLIFPIIKESHWFLAIVCNASNVPDIIQKNDKPIAKKGSQESDESVIEKRPCIIFMDSLGNASYKKSLSTPIREFLSFEWKEKKGSDISFKSKTVIKDFFPRVPNQTNSSDCGLFVLEYTEQFLSKPDYLVKKLFTNPKTAFVDWFPIAEAKNKRPLIRTLILSLLPGEIAEKLEVLIKEEKESDDENKDEITSLMEVDKNDDKDDDFVPPNSIEELSSDD